MIVVIKVKQANILTIEASDEVSSGKIASDIIYFLYMIINRTMIKLVFDFHFCYI